MTGHRLSTLIRGALFQFALVGVAAAFYFLVRGFTQGSESMARTNAQSILRVERVLGLDVEAGVQDIVLRRPPLTTVANWIYMWGHWPVIAPALVALYVQDRKHFVVLRNAMFLSGAIGLLIFALWPVAPPRLLHPSAGYVDTVTTWSNSYRILQPPALVNKYAAMPSFHVGWNLIVGVIVWKTVRRSWARLLAVASPVLMATAVVATANHFVLDFVIGCAIALAALAGSYRLHGYTSRRGTDLDFERRERGLRNEDDRQVSSLSLRPRRRGATRRRRGAVAMSSSDTRENSVAAKRRVVIMGAGGRDFHDFNTVFRDHHGYEVVAFTAAQIPLIDDRLYPPGLAGPRYPDGIPIRPESELADIIRDHDIDEVVLAYSDLSYPDVMHRSSIVLAAGANFSLLGPKSTMLHANCPVVAVCATRTGCGKSQTSRRVGRLLLDAGLRVTLVRHRCPTETCPQ